MKWAFLSFELMGFVLAGGFLGWLFAQGLGGAVGVFLGFLLWSLHLWKIFTKKQ